MKVLLLVILAAFVCQTSYSQEKMLIGILPFTYVSGAANFQDVNSISESVVTSFVKTKRFGIVDRSKLDEVSAEKQLQKSADFVDGTVADQGKSMGAQFLISGHVNSATKSEQYKTRTKLDGTTENYLAIDAQVSFTCKVIDVATGQVVNSESFKNQPGLLSLASNKEEAFNNVLKSLAKSIDKWVSKNFPLIFDMVEVQTKDKKGNPSEILIGAGSDSGVSKGDKITIIEVSTVKVGDEMKTRNKEIGFAKVSKIEDGSFSICVVTDGADILNERLAANAVIKFKTVDK
jgi:TolB-like protein